MKYKIILFIIILFLACEQSTGPSSFGSYFPLHVGNSWTLEHGLKISTLEYTISTKNDIDGLTFYTFGYADFDNRLIMQDDGKIYQRIDDENRLWLDFSRDDKETYKFFEGDSSQAFYNVKVFKDQTVHTKMRTLAGCIMFYFDNPEIQGEEFWFVFAKNIGLVVTGSTAHGDWGLIDYELN